MTRHAIHAVRSRRRSSGSTSPGIHFRNLFEVRYTLSTPAARPIAKPTKNSHGVVPSRLSSTQPSQAPRTIASTNENPTVLSAPMVRTVSDSGFFVEGVGMAGAMIASPAADPGRGHFGGDVAL